VTAGKSFGEIESVKATSDLMSGVSGTVTAVNTKLGESPELVNNDAFDGGWMVKVKVSDPGQLNSLMSAEQYEAQLGS